MTGYFVMFEYDLMQDKSSADKHRDSILVYPKYKVGNIVQFDEIKTRCCEHICRTAKVEKGDILNFIVVKMNAI